MRLNFGNICDFENFGYAPVRRYWIGAAIGVASSLIGGALSSGSRRRAMEREERQHNAESAYYNRMLNEKYLDTVAGQDLVRRAREVMDRQTGHLRGAQAVGGGTDAAVAVQKEAGAKAVGDMMSHVASQDVARQDAAMQSKINSDRQHVKSMSGYDNSRADNISQVASGLSDAAMQLDGVNSEKTAGVEDAVDSPLKGVDRGSFVGVPVANTGGAETKVSVGGVPTDEEYYKMKHGVYGG